MSKIDDIREMVAKARIPKALKELRALIVRHGLEDDYENQLVSLQSRHTSYMNNEQMGLMDPRDLNLEKNRLVAAINYYISNIEDDLPEEALNERIEDPSQQSNQNSGSPASEPTMSPEEALAKEIEVLTGSISHNTKKLEFLRDKLIIESNPSTQFNLETEIAKAEKELDEDRTRLNNLKETQTPGGGPSGSTDIA